MICVHCNQWRVVLEAIGNTSCDHEFHLSECAKNMISKDSDCTCSDVSPE